VVLGYQHRATEAEAVVAATMAAGGQAFAVRADTSSEADVTHLFDAAIGRSGAVDAS
jgi:NAD(P)-dependent dehydrogenase (short-subunit alcohol dehydrogenase family)